MPKANGAAGTDAGGDADKLVRQAAGTYRTADDRFEVRGSSASGWFLVDTAQANDFGQELITGPHATLDAVRASIPSARSSKVTPIRPPAQKSSKAKRSAPPRPPPKTWIDKLPKPEAASVRRLIAELESAGVSSAEDLVR